MTGAAGTVTKGQRWLPLVFTAAVAAVWTTALAGPFQFDDYNVIVNYPPVHSLAAWWEALPGIRPLLKLSYALNWSLSPSPAGFHAVNLLLHLLNALLLWAWARRVLPLAPAPAVALLLAALWALHPVQTEAVTYIAGRSMTLSTTFLLAGLLVLARAPRGAAAWAALCTALALMVRETAWIFPLVFALVEFLRGSDARSACRRTWPAALVVLLGACVFLLEPHYRHLVDVSLSLRGLGEQLRLQVAAHAYLLSALLTLAPNIDPDIRLPAPGAAVLLQGLALAGIAVAALCHALRHRSWVAAGVVWYCLLLLPTNSFMPRVDAASDRHLYAALAGPLWSLLLLMQGRRFAHAAAAALLLLFALATLVRNEDYRSEQALWARTAQQSPDKSRVWNNLGVACRDAGKRECATEAFAQAIRLDPQDMRPAVNLYFLRKSGGTPDATANEATER